ncbi:hypothetical protein VPH35_093201 [Triticum aestivum]
MDDDEEELFDRYDPEVLAANGIDYQELSRFPFVDERMDIKWWAFLMQVEGRLTPARMSTPPLRVIRYPDLMEKGWGWWRLLPIYRDMDSDMPLYRQYLCEYYLRNPPESVDGIGATFTEQKVVVRSAWTNESGRLIPLANKCLEMEAKLLYLCDTNMTKPTDKETALSRGIKGRAHDIINGACEYLGAYAAAAALVCISKEAELMCEWVTSREYKSSYRNCMESNQIREHALSLMLYKGSGSIMAAAGAAMVGAAEEAKLLLQFLRQDQSIDKSMCDAIREEACCILQDMCTEAFGANAKNSFVAAGDGVEESTCRINTVGKSPCRESNDKEDPKRELASEGCTEKIALNGKEGNMENGIKENTEKTDNYTPSGKDNRVPAATDSESVTSLTAPAAMEHRDLTERADVKASAPALPPAPESTKLTVEAKIDMIFGMVIGMAKDIAIIKGSLEKMHATPREASEVPVGSEFGDSGVRTPSHRSSCGSDNTEFTMVDFDFAKD